MRLGAFISGFEDVEILERLTGGGLGIFLVGDGVFHAVAKGAGRPPAIFDKDAALYALAEDIQSRGFEESEVLPGVRVITYRDLVDLIMNDFEKLAWL